MASLSARRTLTPFVLLGLLILGLIVALVLVRQSQEIRQKAVPATTVYIEPPTLTVAPGDSFTVNVMVDSGTNFLSAVDLAVDYDPTLIAGLSIEAGPFLPNVLTQGYFDNGTAHISLGSSPSTPANGTGVLATITFQALDTITPNTPIVISQETIAAATEDPAYLGTNAITSRVQGTVSIETISPTPTPSPTITPSASPLPSIAPSPSPSASPVAQGINWDTGAVSLTSTDFSIAISGTGQRFTDNTPSLELNSVTSVPNYTTLEATWTENNTEMHVNIYFQAAGSQWTITEIRTYNGATPGDWLYNYGPFPLLSRGTAYTGTSWDINLVDAEGFLGAIMHLGNFSLDPTILAVSPSPSPSPVPSTSPSPSPTGMQASYAVRFEAVGVQRPPQTIHVTYRQGGVIVYEHDAVVSSDATGRYSSGPYALPGLVPGIYDILVKGPVHLAHDFGDLSLQQNLNVLDLTSPFQLAGDSITNNEVDIYDHNEQVRNFGCVQGQPPPPGNDGCSFLGDLDLDGDIDIFDHNIKVRNFGLIGDN